MRKRNVFYILGLAWAVWTGAWAGETPGHLKLSLFDLTGQALLHSSRLSAAKLGWESAQAEAGAVGASEFPRLGLSGNYFYQTYVPKFSPFPNAPEAVFGKNDNWGAWATLNWNLWDFRAQHFLADSATDVSRSQEELYRATERQVKLAVRMAYFQAQAALEQVRLLGDSLKVAQAQYTDIGHQARYGKASRMDRLSSHQEVLNYERQFRQAQSGLAQSLRDLFALVGLKEPGDFSLPLDARMEGAVAAGVSPPTVWLSMDPAKDSMDTLRQESAVPPNDGLPQLKTYAYLADSARSAAEAAHNGLFPKISLFAQAGWENPDGPVLETVQQNIVGLTASMPIFDWGQILQDSDAKRKQSEAYRENLGQAQADLWRDWNKSRDALGSLEYQRALNATAVSETDELAKLTYGAYRAGTTRFLEVQTANFQALNAKVQAVGNDLQILMQLSVLASLSGKE
ncbi:MAG TPA: TolC family protein [bacterium]|nr:TolC family protein [bacterium]